MQQPMHGPCFMPKMSMGRSNSNLGSLTMLTISRIILPHQGQVVFGVGGRCGSRVVGVGWWSMVVVGCWVGVG